MGIFLRSCLIFATSLAWPGPAVAQNINPGANQGAQSQGGGSGANNAAGAALIGAGAAMMTQPPTVPMGIAMVAMGIIALAQGSHDKNAAQQSAATANATNLGKGPTGTNKTTTYADPEKGVAGALATPEGKKAAAAIEAAGGEVSNKGVKLPNGDLKPWSSFSSAGSLASAGFDSKELMKKVGEIEKNIAQANAAVKSMALRDGEGPGGAVPSPNGGSESGNAEGSGNVAFRMPAGLTPEQRARLVSGKTVDAGGEAIYTKGDNLFEIIHRAYDRRREGHHFILTENLISAQRK